MKFTVYTKDLGGAEAYLNGKRLKFKKDGKRLAAECEAEGDIELRIFSKSLLSFDKWFLKWLLLWFLGVFGLFSPHFRKTDKYYIDYRLFGKVTEDSTVTVELNKRAKNKYKERALLVRCDFEAMEENTGWAEDERFRSRRRTCKLITALFWVLAVLSAIALVLFKFIF